jgi:hypothetical protein
MGMTTTKLSIDKIEDREGDGTCRHCDREGLRWIFVLSDGTEIGSGCARKVLGFAPAPKAFAWVSKFEAVATANGYTLYQSKTHGDAVMAIAQGANLVVNGPGAWVTSRWTGAYGAAA